MFLFAKINPREKRENCSIRENKSSRNTEKCDSRKLIHAKICHRENFSARKFVHLRYITTETIKTKQYAEIPENESWRVPLVKEIVSIKNGPYEVPNFTANEISEILDFAATS